MIEIDNLATLAQLGNYAKYRIKKWDAAIPIKLCDAHRMLSVVSLPTSGSMYLLTLVYDICNRCAIALINLLKISKYRYWETMLQSHAGIHSTCIQMVSTYNTLPSVLQQTEVASPGLLAIGITLLYWMVSSQPKVAILKRWIKIN